MGERDREREWRPLRERVLERLCARTRETMASKNLVSVGDATVALPCGVYVGEKVPEPGDIASEAED